MKFSERIGRTGPKRPYQADGMDDELRYRLWNKLLETVFKEHLEGLDFFNLRSIYSQIFDEFLKIPIDQAGQGTFVQKKALRNYYLGWEWYKVYDFLEFVVQDIDTKMAEAFNEVLEEEKSAYRFVDQQLAPISDETEIEAISAAANLEDKFSGAREHIKRSLELFSKRPHGDYLNTIKEAISAVESAAKVISEKDSATLSDALKSLEKQKPMHPAFKESLKKLYGYTSDEGGIRHALMDAYTDVDEADAHFMIVLCSAFVNFVVSRYR